MDIDIKQTRRRFIKSTLITTLIAGSIIAAPLSAIAQTNKKKKTNIKNSKKIKPKPQVIEKPKPIVWNEEWDILIIGSGFAGSAAFCESVDAGAKTLLIDKMSSFGGNSVISEGAFAVVNSTYQVKRGINDSTSIYLDDNLKIGANLNDPELIKTVAKYSNQTYNFTIKRGVTYEESLKTFSGHALPRTIYPEAETGKNIVLPLQRYAIARGGIMKEKTILDDIIFDETDGSVTGVKVREEYQFNQYKKRKEESNKTGVIKYYKLTTGLILCTGGFAYDNEFINKIDPKIPKDLDSTNHFGATSQAITMLMKNNIETEKLNLIELNSNASPDEQGYGISSMFAALAYNYGIAIDRKNGKRFMNELAPANEKAQEIFKVWKNSKGNLLYPLVICDSTVSNQIPDEILLAGLQSGVIREFKTTDEIARFYKISQVTLSSTLEKYREAVKSGTDNEFNKPIIKYKGEDVNLSKPPYYTIQVSPKIHHTMGGIKINTDAQVISKKTGAPIAKLFAAGESTSGVHGLNRLEATSTTDCLVFGRIAAQNAVKNLQK